MKKILLTILAGIGGVSALLADGGRPVIITKTDHKSPITLGNSVCVTDEIRLTSEFKEAWLALEPNFYGRVIVRTPELGMFYDICSHVANWKNEGYTAPAQNETESAAEQAVPEESASEKMVKQPDIVSSEEEEDERICTRMEGCEINLNGATEEEYCPTCVWKSEVKKT
jgi:hypothetical protein